MDLELIYFQHPHRPVHSENIRVRRTKGEMEPKLDETVEKKLTDRHLIAILSIE